MPAPKGNQNALRSGQRVRSGLQIGGPMPGHGYITVALRRFRTALESAVVERHGEINLTHSALINSAVRWERVCALGQKWLRTEGSKLSTLDRMRLVTDIAKASDSRDRCVARLDIDARQSDLWAGLHAPQPAVTSPDDDDDQSPVDGRQGEPDAHTEGEVA